MAEALWEAPRRGPRGTAGLGRPRQHPLSWRDAVSDERGDGQELRVGRTELAKGTCRAAAAHTTEARETSFPPETIHAAGLPWSCSDLALRSLARSPKSGWC